MHITYENHPITTSVHHNFEVVTASFVRNVNDLYRVMDGGEIFFFKHISAQKLDLHMYNQGSNGEICAYLFHVLNIIWA